MSFQPQWSASVLVQGTQYELRRRASGCQPGTLVLVYTSQTVKAVTGHFTVGQCLQAPLDELWGLVGGKCGVEREDFDHYLNGAAQPTAIEVKSPMTVKPINLGFRGPMSYQYLDRAKPEHARLLSHVER